MSTKFPDEFRTSGSLRKCPYGKKICKFYQHNINWCLMLDVDLGTVIIRPMKHQCKIIGETSSFDPVIPEEYEFAPGYSHKDETTQKEVRTIPDKVADGSDMISGEDLEKW